MNMQEVIRSTLARHREVVDTVEEALTDDIIRVAERLIGCLSGGHTLFLCGNGGSAADAQHIAAEFTGRFLRQRDPLRAIALTTDTSALTAIGNDFGFDAVFERQVRALARKGDMLLGISTSGNSPNVVRALSAARGIGCVTVALTGHDGGEMSRTAEYSLIVPSEETPRIQEMHVTIGHILCDMIDRWSSGEQS
jgi:D-sedoheptulose 7-phosphate isomerase